MSFFDELKRRNVFRVALAYVVIAWLLLQVGDTIKTEALLQNLHEDPRWEELLTSLGLSDPQVAAIEI